MTERRCAPCSLRSLRALTWHAVRQAGVGRLGASFDAAEADVDAALAASSAASSGAAARRTAELASLREALGAKDRALASLRETLESACVRACVRACAAAARRNAPRIRTPEKRKHAPRCVR